MSEDNNDLVPSDDIIAEIVEDELPIVIDSVKAPDEDYKREADFEYTRNNLYKIIATALASMEKLSKLADQSQHPRAYEVLAGLMKTIADAQKDLMELHKKNQEAKTALENTESETKVVNQNLFIGTTQELDELIKKLKDQ